MRNAYSLLGNMQSKNVFALHNFFMVRRGTPLVQVRTLGMSSGRKERISDAVSDVVERLRDQLDELDELRGGIEDGIKSAVNLIPSLNEEKEHLQDNITANRERIGEIDKMIPKLEKQKVQLGEELQEKQEQISQIEDRIEFLSQTDRTRS